MKQNVEARSGVAQTQIFKFWKSLRSSLRFTKTENAHASSANGLPVDDTLHMYAEPSTKGAYLIPSKTKYAPSNANNPAPSGANGHGNLETADAKDLSACDTSTTTSRKSSFRQNKLAKVPSSKEVGWSDVVFHSHEIILGDNPAVSCGPPVAVGSTEVSTDTLSIEEYENHRGPRRIKESLLIPPSLREDLLREEGYCRSEIRDVEADVNKIKKFRKKNARENILKRVQHSASRNQRQLRVKAAVDNHVHHDPVG